MDVKSLFNQWSKKITPVISNYQWILVVILVGILLMLWPKDQSEVVVEQGVTQNTSFDLEELETKLEEVLSNINGAGNVQVILTLDSSAKQIVAQDGETVLEGDDIEKTVDTVIISQGSGLENVVPIQEMAPTFRGAIVVCDGGDNATVCLQMTRAVAAVTGLSTNKIAVCTGG